jgi:hypothetical protein
LGCQLSFENYASNTALVSAYGLPVELGDNQEGAGLQDGQPANRTVRQRHRAGHADLQEHLPAHEGASSIDAENIDKAERLLHK